MLLRLLPVLLLAACSQEPGAPAAPKRTFAEREQAAQADLARAPVPRIYHYEQGELRVFEVPVQITRTSTGTQTCIVWRDAEMRTAAMQCPVDTPDPPMSSGSSDSSHP